MQISIILLGKLINFFIMILLGFILVNKNILKSSDSRILSIIVEYLVMPCAIICSFEIDFTKEKLQGLLFSAVIAVIIHVLLLIFINTLQFSLLEFLAKTNIYKCLHQDLKIKPP